MISIHKFYVFSFMHNQRLLSMHLHDALVEFKDKVKHINNLSQNASPLKPLLGYEPRPLSSGLESILP